ncbi:MAG: hypothetical protein MUO26_05905 [Methanotrichaceae archaeon]|nr:hypothetical protein [Methanotrichaceae archaeon]
MEIMLSVFVLTALAILGFTAYVLLNFGAKEPRHRYRDLFLAIYGFTLITMVVVGLFAEWHIVFPWQELTAFYAVYGFAACVFLIYFAKGLRLWLPKEEDYYEKKEGM